MSNLEYSQAVQPDSLFDLIKQPNAGERSLPLSQHARESIDRFLQEFPSYVTPFWGYEIPMTYPEWTADVLICISDPILFAQFLEERQRASHLPFSKDNINKWSRLAWIWKEELRLEIANIWLEFDYEDIHDENGRSSFFFAPSQTSHILKTLQVASVIFGELVEEDVDPASFRSLLRCHGALPQKSWISQIGIMSARNESSIRCYIQDLPTYSLKSFLKRIEFPQWDRTDLLKLIDFCYLHSRQLNLDLDLGDQVGSKLGLECYFSSTRRSIEFVEQAVELGLCLPNKAIKVRQFLEQIKRNKNGKYQQFMSHFKVVYSADEQTSLKMYAGYIRQDIAHSIINSLHNK